MIKQEHSEGRLAEYRRYKQMYLGQHVQAFNETLHNREKENLIYAVQNFCAIVAHVSADYLVGSGVTITSEDDNQQAIIDEINNRVNPNTKIYEAALAASIYGDSVFLVHEDDAGSVDFSVINPSKYHPVFDVQNPSVATAVNIETPFEADEVHYVLVEAYTIGNIQRVLYQVTTSGERNQIPLSRLFPNLQEEEATNIDFIPIRHVKNFSLSGMPFGISDFRQIDALQHALNNRLTQIETILDKHADPKFAVPAGVLDEKGEVARGNLEMFELPGGDGAQQKPEYITWDSNIDAAFNEIDLIMKQIARVCEIPLSLLFPESAGSADSGVAIRLRYASLLKKIQRKKAYFEPALEDLYKMMLKVSGIKDPNVQIEFEETIPEDITEKSNIITARLSNGTLSKQEAIERYDDISPSEAEQKLSDIQAGQPRPIENTPPKVTLPPQETPQTPQK